MSDCMIIRRGGGKHGFDPNGAVLKVVTSTGCTVLVTGTGYSKTHQQADGYPRSSDADATEHFFSIPASAFGTITVTVSKVYTNEGVSDTLTASKAIAVNTAGKVYELSIAAPNIILNSTFGLQSGMICSTSFEYLNREKCLHNKGTYPSGGTFYNVFTNGISVNVFDTLSVKARCRGDSTYADITLEDTDNVRLAYIYFNRDVSTEKSATISNKYYPKAYLLYSRQLDYIDEIILS